MIEKVSLMDVTIALQNMVIAGWMRAYARAWYFGDNTVSWLGVKPALTSQQIYN
jgi:hypothetical protein